MTKFMMRQNIVIIRIFILVSLWAIVYSCEKDCVLEKEEITDTEPMPNPTASTDSIKEERNHLATFLYGTTWDYVSGDLTRLYMEYGIDAVYNQEMSFFANGNIKSLFTISQGQKGVDDIECYNVMELGLSYDSICIFTLDGYNKVECKLVFTDDSLKNELKLNIGDNEIVYHKRENGAIINEYMIYGSWEYIITNSDTGKKEFIFEYGGTGIAKSEYINGKWFVKSSFKWRMDSERVMMYCPDYIVESVGTEHWFIQFCNNEYMKLGDMYLKRIKK